VLSELWTIHQQEVKFFLRAFMEPPIEHHEPHALPGAIGKSGDGGVDGINKEGGNFDTIGLPLRHTEAP